MPNPTAQSFNPSPTFGGLDIKLKQEKFRIPYHPSPPKLFQLFKFYHCWQHILYGGMILECSTPLSCSVSLTAVFLKNILRSVLLFLGL